MLEISKTFTYSYVRSNSKSLYHAFERLVLINYETNFFLTFNSTKFSFSASYLFHTELVIFWRYLQSFTSLTASIYMQIGSLFLKVYYHNIYTQHLVNHLCRGIDWNYVPVIFCYWYLDLSTYMLSLREM